MITIMITTMIITDQTARNILKGGIWMNTTCLSMYYISFQMHIIMLKLPKQVACQNMSGLMNS